MVDSNIFYESQLNNPKLTWELFAQPWSDRGIKVTQGKPTVTLLRGIIPETEFGISGSHDFSSTQVPYAGKAVQLLGDGFNRISENAAIIKGGLNSVTSKVKKLGAALTTTDDFISGLASKVGGGEVYNDVKNLAGSRFITSFDKVAIYKGTNLEINFPPLETRIYSGTFNKEPEDTAIGRENSTNITLKELEDELITRFIGPINKFAQSVGLDTVMGSQSPPNGYVPSFELIDPDTYIEGAFLLRYGPYEIPNLLVTSFSYRTSTFKVRQNPLYPNTTGRVSEVQIIDNDEPLYIDVRIQVQPCTYITKELISKIMKLNSIKKST